MNIHQPDVRQPHKPLKTAVSSCIAHIKMSITKSQKKAIFADLLDRTVILHIYMNFAKLKKKNAMGVVKKSTIMCGNSIAKVIRDRNLFQ